MRLQLVELEDLPWWPAVVRDLSTDYLHFGETLFALHQPVVDLLGDALRDTQSRRLVDLCSGGAGPIPSLLAALRERGYELSAVLTDRHPNPQAFQQAALKSNGAITFAALPVDARAVPRELTGFRTIFNAFHHFAPEDAAAVLRDACDAQQPIGVFEIPQRSLLTALPLLFTPIYVLLATPFIRPFRWERLLWTYLLPLVLLTCWWDGLVSQLRAYEPSELRNLATKAQPGYRWLAGRVPIGRTPGNLTYLIGVPEAP
ncbi:MAG: class I SAM-dependent methyltransferase [Vicinamibacterales bacterium]